MKLAFLPICIVLLCTAACKKDSLAGLSPQRIRFDQLEIGQTSRYLRFQAGICTDTDNDFKYIGDTLVLEIIAEKADTFVFKEYLTAGSFSLQQPGSPLALFAVGEIQGNLFVESGMVHAVYEAGASHSLPLFSEFSFPLAKIERPKLDLKAWYPEVENDPTHQGYLKNYDQLGIEFPRLNYILNYLPMQSDGPGKFYFYTAEYGVVRAGTRHGWCTEKGLGWDLLPG